MEGEALTEFEEGHRDGWWNKPKKKNTGIYSTIYDKAKKDRAETEYWAGKRASKDG